MEIKERSGITPSSEIILLNIKELEPTYSNTYLFKTKESQTNFFKSKAIPDGVCDKYTYIRKDSTIKVNKHIDEIHNANYLMYKNKYNKYYYCFILDKLYINETVTALIIATDVMQTYMFNYHLKDSFVDRCHVHRWTQDGKPTDEFEQEGLEYGEYEQHSSETIYSFKDSYIAVCSNPLGQLENRRMDFNGQGGGGDEPTCGDWKTGQISPQGFRFIKGFEGFARMPYQYSGDVPTIGYGTTKDFNPKEFEQLYHNGKGCTEEEASIVFYNKLIKSYCQPIVERLIQLGITEQQQADALFSLAYNAGIYDILNNTELMKVIQRNPKDEQSIRTTWLTFRIRPGTIFEAGLRERRKEEVNMYFGKYSARPIQKIPYSEGIVKENNGNGWMPNCGESFDAEGESWFYPLRNKTGKVNSLYGFRFHPITGKWKLHSGIDVGCALNTPIYATKGGKVVHAGDIGDGYGKYIRIRHENIEMETWYCHNNELKVKVGEQVNAGQVIALAGTSGQSTGVHLHYELRVQPYSTKDTTRNPIPSAKVGDIF